MRQELRIAGFGGQGVISMGILIATAVGKYEGKEVAQTQSYGPEARGGACKTEVVISEEEIDYIKALQPDVLVAMSQPALDKYVVDIDAQKCLVIVDNTIVDNVPATIRRVVRIPATKMAEEQIGDRVVANVLMLGAVTQLSNFLSYETARQAIADNMSPKTLEKNLKAFEIGYQYAASLQKQ